MFTQKVYTPAEKRKYYGDQLKTGKDAKGNKLTDRQKSFRAGYCNAVGDGVAAYKAKERKNKKTT